MKNRLRSRKVLCLRLENYLWCWRRKWTEYLGDRWGTVCGRRHKITWLREEERKQYLLLKKKKRERICLRRRNRI